MFQTTVFLFLGFFLFFGSKYLGIIATWNNLLPIHMYFILLFQKLLKKKIIIAIARMLHFAIVRQL